MLPTEDVRDRGGIVADGGREGRGGGGGAVLPTRDVEGEVSSVQ